MHDNHKVKPIHIMLPKKSVYVKSYDEQTKWMYFLIEDHELLKKYSTVWDKASADTKKEFDSRSVYNKEFLKSHGDEVTDLYRFLLLIFSSSFFYLEYLLLTGFEFTF